MTKIGKDSPMITLIQCSHQCEHQWDGQREELVDDEGQFCGESASCSKCGILAIDADLMEAQ